MPTRSTQPYRKGKPRPPGQALLNMMRGRTATGQNPADIQRAAQAMIRAGKRPTRTSRAPRPPR